MPGVNLLHQSRASTYVKLRTRLAAISGNGVFSNVILMRAA